MTAAEKGYKRLMEGYKIANGLEFAEGAVDVELETSVKATIDSLFENMSQDFNTAKALAVLFEMTTIMNNFKAGNIKTGQLSKDTFDTLIKHYIGFITEVLGLKEEKSDDNQLVDGVMDLLIKLRNDAKAAKNYSVTDKIRDDLKSLGVSLKDGKEGTEYSID